MSNAVRSTAGASEVVWRGVTKNARHCGLGSSRDEVAKTTNEALMGRILAVTSTLTSHKPQVKAAEPGLRARQSRAVPVRGLADGLAFGRANIMRCTVCKIADGTSFPAGLPWTEKLPAAGS
jgi:hypothetical protein